jgi:septum formation protein
MPAIKIILASASPRREMLLKELIGDSFVIFPVDIDESVLADEKPATHTLRLARAKALKAGESFADGLIIGSDTIVTIDNRILGKPTDTNDAEYMLKSLRGKTHSVITSFCILEAHSNHELTRTVESRVTIKELTDNEITDYIATGEPMDKAGSYAAQGLGRKLIEKLEGSYTNVVGLPLDELKQSLEAFNNS